ncbi:MAG: diacylglycerol kinase family protein [bacterium]
MNKPFNPCDRIKSFRYAFKGILLLIKSQHNAWIHTLATIAVCSAGFYFGFTRSEWCWILLTMMAVWTAEGFNTAFEFLADAVSPDYHPLLGKAKDVAAGAVLISAMGSAMIGILIIGPYVLRLFVN